MNKAKCLMVIVLAAGTLFAEERDGGFNTAWGEGWRVTVGGAMNGNLRSKLELRPGRALRGLSMPRPAGGMSQGDAQAQGDAYDVGNGRTTFPNGGFIDPEDAAGVAGQTWNWYVPAGALDADGTMSFSSPYSESAFAESGRNIHGKDDDYAAGFSVNLEREFWRKGAFGFDLGLGFSFFRNNDFFKAGGQAYSRREAYASGDYVTDVSFAQDIIDDPWAQNADGSYGAGTADGPGPVLDLNSGDVTVSHRWENQTSSSRSASYSVFATGDYEETELTLAVKPFWDVTDWFRVRGTLGAAVSRTHFVFDVYGRGDGADYSDRQRFDDWAVYGVGGLGGMFSHKGVCLGFDVIARFLDDEIKIHGRDVHGSVERAPWMLTAYVGYEF